MPGIDGTCVSMLHMDGADTSTVFTDEKGKTWTAAGNAQIDTAQSKFGGASALFTVPGGDHVSTPASADFNLLGDWTIDYWYRAAAYDAGNNIHVYVGTGAGDKIVIATISTAGYLYYLLNGVARISTTTNIGVNTWGHAALVKYSGTTRLYLNGTDIGNTAGVPTSSNKSVDIGADAGAAYYQGHIDEFRITNGLARWTANFTPPTEAYTFVGAGNQVIMVA